MLTYTLRVFMQETAGSIPPPMTRGEHVGPGVHQGVAREVWLFTQGVLTSPGQ